MTFRQNGFKQNVMDPFKKSEAAIPVTIMAICIDFHDSFITKFDFMNYLFLTWHLHCCISNYSHAQLN